MALVKRIMSIKSRLSSWLFNVLYKRIGRFYIEDYPELNGTAFSKIYPTLLCHNIEILTFNKAENQVYLQKGPICFSTSPEYPWIAREVFAQHIYFINPRYLKATKYVVFDIGMNRGYASLYFATQSWCMAVHGFEPNELTFKQAMGNVDLNPALKDKINLYNVGLGNKDEQLKCYYLPHRDGICTTSFEFLKDYAPEEVDQVIEKEITIKKTSTVLQRLVEDLPANVGIILKIDVEGAEYDILQDLIKDYPELLKRVEIIIGEAHLGLEPINKTLDPFGFVNVSQKNYNPKTQDFLFMRP
jgi:FkbM family methyltransferase